MSRLSAVSAGAPLLALSLFACDNGTGAAVGPGSRILTYRGNGQASVVGAALPDSIQVKVTDANDHPVEGVRIQWAPGADGLVSPAASTTDADGLAATRWTLATTPGTQSLDATSGILETTASATATVGPADSLVLVAGAGQGGIVGEPLGDTVVVRLADAYGNPIAQETVTWMAKSGSVAADARTDAEGIARAVWTLGGNAGAQQLRVAADDLERSIDATAFAAEAEGLTLLGGNDQTGTVGDELEDTLMVRVADAYGNPVGGVEVTWSVSAEAASIAPKTGATDSTGVARAAWTLGTVAGQQSAVVAIAGDTILFDATATAGPPTGLTIVAGDNQVGGVATTLSDSLTVHVVDAHDNPVVGAEVAWLVVGETGSIKPSPAVTDSTGMASGAWTLGTIAGAQAAEATIAGMTVAFRARAEAGPADTVAVAAGDGQTAEIDNRLGDSLVVVVHDAFGNPVVGATVTWSVTAGGGAVEPVETATDSAGFARAAWTLGGTVGTQSVEAAVGAATVTFTAEATEPGCTLDMPDNDADRLPDCAETGTGVFVSFRDAGTDPADPDTDGDGISDGDEVLSTEGGLDLPALGANPLRTTILMEYDWFVDSDPQHGTCPVEHSHRPTLEAMAMVEAMFTSAPVTNPDGSTGIDIIQDYGQGGPFTGGNFIDDADSFLDGGFGTGDEYPAYKATHFAANRNGYFHYVILPHYYSRYEGSSGLALWHGFDMIVSLGCSVPDNNPGVDYAVAHTIAHELGHNLGLLHGGPGGLESMGLNYKPNYNSLMNYQYQFAGIDADCDGIGDDVMDFSTGSRPPLDEHALDERLGICGGAGPALDFDSDARIDTVLVAVDINPWREGRPDISGDGSLSVLHDGDDWSNLWFPSIASGGAMLLMDREPVVIVEQPVPDDLQPREVRQPAERRIRR